MATSSGKPRSSAKPKKKAPAKRKAAAKKKTSAAKKKPAARAAAKPVEVSVPDEITLDAPEEVTFKPTETSTVQPARAAVAVRGIRERDLTAVMRQLIMLLEAGTPMLKALNSIGDRGDRHQVRALVKNIATQVEGGSPLWQAFSQHPAQFPPVFVNLIKAGEASGTVVPILRRVVVFREKRAMLARRMQSALLYPAVLTVFCFAVIVLIAKFVIPQFLMIFKQFQVEPQGPAALMLDASQWLADAWWWLALLVIGVVAVYRMFIAKNPVFSLTLDRIRMRIPIFGPITRRAAIIDFCRTFSILIRSGLSMMATLDLARNSVSNRALVDSIQDMRDSIERGEGLEKPLRVAERQKVFPSVVVDMLVTGEETGTIDNVAEQIATQYEEEVEIAVDALGEAIQPIATVFMGVVVGGIVFALFGPLIQMIERLAEQGAGL